MTSRIRVAMALCAVAVIIIAAGGVSKRGASSEVWTHATASSASDSEYSYDTTDAISIKGWNSLHYKFTLKVDTSTAGGQGLKDTGRIIAQTFRNGAWVSIDSTNKAAGAPTTWLINKRISAPVGDTLLGDSFRFVVCNIDTVQDSIITLHDSGTWEWTVK
jgi:hypothetical protein